MLKNRKIKAAKTMVSIKITISAKIISILTVALLTAPFIVFAVNDVQVTANTNFSLTTADTVAAAALTLNIGGQATDFDVQNNYIDVTLDDLSSVTFNTATAGQYLKITKISGSDDYTISPGCPTTSATLNGTGTQAILRLQVLTTSSCIVTPPPPPPSSGGGGGGGGVSLPLPSNISFKINNNSPQTISNNVTLTFSGDNITGLLISNYANFPNGSWEAYTPSKNWALLPGEGYKTVYVRFRSSGGEAPGTFSAAIKVTASITPPEQPPIVQSATTTICAPYITKNIARNAINDANEVINFQTFLRDYENFSALKITGIYDLETFNAVKEFQIKYAQDILAPWGFTSPTGMVNVTTIKKINSLYCEKNNPPTPITAALPPAGTGTGNGTGVCSANFTRNLKLGMTGDDVKELQKYLNNNNYLIAVSGAGSKGQETNFFGSLTEIALARFQKDNNILGALGIFDLATRNFLNCVTPTAPITSVAYDTNLSNRLKGRILLRVEDHGEAYYIYPNDLKKYYLGTPDDAFRVMRVLGLGANNKFITDYTVYPVRVAGKILINVEDHGKAYYISPLNRRAYYLGSPDQAYQVIRSLGLGITNANLNKIADGILN